ncbi:hypothetical protein COY62_01350 [bacterium (Candidatus Howlettbacteria) CG_4_10_14_0_8_um_filter_40_9]|nr:MAG: hypothetical protein COY62_01350 [bacterium (Candidatus Howlettbacteria) CG_4_10_14_0_8_um_filter_40_9]
MGFGCEMKDYFSFIYKVSLDNNMIEHEYLHVFVGNYGGQPVPNIEEAEDWRWISSEELGKDISQNPNDYTPWFLLSMPKVMEHLNSKKI